MKAIVSTGYGPPEVLQQREVPKPSPRKNQVCIRIHATSVTASECIARALNVRFPYWLLARLVLGFTAPRKSISGMVLAGEVESVGRNVRSFAVGDQVFGMSQWAFGAYAEYVCWRESAVLALKPANLTFEEAAAIPYGGLLALHCLKKTAIQSGKRILVYGASGSIGTSAVQLARHFGAEVTGVCSGVNLELVQSLGAVRVIDYTKEDFTQRPERYDIILDAVGRKKSAKALAQSQIALNPGGINLSIDDDLPKAKLEGLMLLRRLAEAGELKPVIDRSYKLEQMVEAHRYVDLGHKKGNVVITVGSP